jgi:hypothetical protein
MPKIISPAMRAHLDEETTRLAAIWRITRKDGQQFFFTDHDRDIGFGGEVYRADAGFARTAIRSDAGFAVDNLDLVGVFAEGGIVRFDSRTGALYTPTSGSGIEQWLPGRSSDDSAVLGDVVTPLCERVGLTAADLDVSELTDEVHGFGIARQISVRGGSRCWRPPTPSMRSRAITS